MDEARRVASNIAKLPTLLKSQGIGLGGNRQQSVTLQRLLKTLFDCSSVSSEYSRTPSTAKPVLGSGSVPNTMKRVPSGMVPQTIVPWVTHIFAVRPPSKRLNLARYWRAAETRSGSANSSGAVAKSEMKNSEAARQPARIRAVCQGFAERWEPAAFVVTGSRYRDALKENLLNQGTPRRNGVDDGRG